jgi:hypothetical protein
VADVVLGAGADNAPDLAGDTVPKRYM